MLFKLFVIIIVLNKSASQIPGNGNSFQNILRASFLPPFPLEPYSQEFFTYTVNNPVASMFISKECKEQYEVFIEDLREKKSAWSQRMIDSFSDVARGHVLQRFNHLGDFDKCVTSASANISGKYCLGNVIEMQNTSLRLKNPHKFLQGFWSSCIPNKCTYADSLYLSNQILTLLLNDLGVFLVFTEENCQTIKDVNPELDFAAIITIVLVSAMTALVLYATFHDLYCRSISLTKCPKVISFFSIYTNGKSLFKITSHSENMPYLDGIKVFSMMWVVIGHQTMFNFKPPIENPEYSDEWMRKLYNMLIVSGHLSVDTFLLISGLLMALSFFKNREKKVVFNLFSYYQRRYIRLTSVLIWMVLICATLIKYLGSGPLWFMVNQGQGVCQKYWWSALLYIQNYYNPTEACVPHSWYLSVDMQLFMVSPLVLFGLWLYPKTILGALLLCMAASIGEGLRVMHNFMSGKIDPFDIRNSIEPYWVSYYAPTHTRISPWIIGVILGYIFFRNKNRTIKISRVTNLSCWVFAFLTLLFCVLGTHAKALVAMGFWYRVAYHVMIRPIWSIAVAWMMFSCHYNYGGPVQWLLSLELNQILGRFAYALYLAHFSLMTILWNTKRQPENSTSLWLMFDFWGSLAFSFIAAFWLIFCAEKPIALLEREFTCFPEKIVKKKGNVTKNGALATHL